MALFSNTLAVMRRYLAEAVGDLIYGTADSGTVNTLVHTMLRKGDDYYNKHQYRAYIYGGPAIGEEREVSDWTVSNNTLVLDPVYSNAITNVSQYELHHIFYADEYLKAINLAIESLAGKYLVDIIDDTTITLVAATYEYALPTSMLYLYQVTTENAVADDEFRLEDVIDPRIWGIMKAYPAQLKLDENRYSIVAGKDLRLEGQGTQPIVDDDTDVIYLPPDWLVQKAITFLPQGKIQSNKLDNTYKQALILSADMPRNWPSPYSQAVVE